MDNEPIKDRTLSAEQLIQSSRGVGNGTMSFRERLSKLFDGSDLVTIKNVLGHDTGWVYADPKKERVEQPDTATRRVTYGDPEAKILKNGETITIPGWQAYIALERMFKEYAQEQGTNMGIIMGSEIEHNNFLDKAYLGIFDPNEQKPIKRAAKVEPVAETVVAADDDLGLDEEPKAPKK